MPAVFAELSEVRNGQQSQEVKRQPFSEDMEMAVLGAIMLDKEGLPSVNEFLSVQSFFLTQHQLIFKAILELYKSSEAIDLVSVTRILRKWNQINEVGGTKYLARLLSKVNSASNIEYHGLVVAQMAIKRQMISVSRDILTETFEENNDIFDVLDRTEQSFFKISEQSIKKQYLDSAAIMKLTIDELESKKLNNKGGLTGIPSGFTGLDKITGGWQKTELTILAARPGMGKTAFVVSSMRNAAVDHDTPVAIFSLEMSATQLMLRMISAEAELDSEKLRKGTLEEHEWQQLHHKLEKLGQAPIFIDDTPALSILELRAKCRRLKAQHNISLVIIDYLQLMTGDDGSGIAGNREQEIATISRSLKNLAKELDVPVIALSQLSRAVETRGGDKRPQLSDLRESGSIEQDADMVMFLYRPEYYKITEDEEGNPTDGLGELILAKNRAGSLDTVKLQFIGRFTKFTDWGNMSTNKFTEYGKMTVPGGEGNFSHFEKMRQNPDFIPTFKSKANPSDNNSSNDSPQVGSAEDVDF
jgi:replicative DNA helicase